MLWNFWTSLHIWCQSQTTLNFFFFSESRARPSHTTISSSPSMRTHPADAGKQNLVILRRFSDYAAGIFFFLNESGDDVRMLSWFTTVFSLFSICLFPAALWRPPRFSLAQCFSTPLPFTCHVSSKTEGGKKHGGLLISLWGRPDDHDEMRNTDSY